MKNIKSNGLKYALLLTSFIVLVNNAVSQNGGICFEEVIKPLTFRNVGPTRGGRVTAVSGVENSPGTFLMGSTGGGVWKTTDYGVTYENISDGYFASPSIGAISVYQKNPDIIYVGTGSDGIRSNVIAGKGVYKTVNGGKSWELTGLDQSGLIGAVEIHPDNPDIVFVAAIGQPFQSNEERGVFRSKDGGKNWDKVLYHSDTIGAVDLEFAPDNPSIIYAALWRTERKPWTVISGADGEGGIYKSVNGGDTWSKVTTGLPKGLIGKIDLAVSAADPKRVYALIEAKDEEAGFYRSDDYGSSFVKVSNQKGLLDRPFYYTNIKANPLDADVVFSMATSFFKSKDAGKTWSRMSTPHGDNHDMWISAKDTSLFIQANDGGVNITTNGGKSWSSQHNQATAELYQVEVDDQYPYWLYAGQQDNTTIAVPSLPPYPGPAGPSSYWLDIGGCETGPAVPKPGSPHIIYSNCKGRFGVYNKLTGQEMQYYVGAGNIYGHNPKDLNFRFQRVAPIFVSQHNPDVVYHGSQYLHKTVNDGLSWEIVSPDLTAFEPDKQVISGAPITRDVTGEEYYSAIYEINESPLEEGVIWVGSNDGPIHVTRDGGGTWSEVTPKDLPKGGRVDCIAPSPHKKGKAYAAILRYQLGDWKPYIYMTKDYGNTWVLLTNGLNGIPIDNPTRVVREDPVQEGVLYAGSEYGLYASLDDGMTWNSIQKNLPITPITDIKVYRGDLILSTMGRSFWIMDNISPLYQLAKSNSTETQILLKPKDTYRFRYRPNTNETTNYPVASVQIDYYFPNSVDGEVLIEILDMNKKRLRAFSNAKSTSQETIPFVDMSTGFYFRDSKNDITANQGLNRFNWDMRLPGPWDSDTGRSFQRGPLAAPGKYIARLTVEGKVYEEEFEVKIDPRLALAEVTQDDILSQLQLLEEIIALENKVKYSVFEIHRNIEELKKSKKTEKIKALNEILEVVETKEGIYMQPMLIDQLAYLRSMLNSADQRPGKDAYERLEHLYSVWRELELKLNTLDLSEFPIKTGD